MHRMFACLAAMLAASPALAQSLTDTTRSASLSLNLIWAGQGSESRCGANWLLVESRGYGAGWYCMRSSALGGAEIYDWGTIRGGDFPGTLLRPPVPGDRRLLLANGTQVLAFDPLTLESNLISTLPPSTTVSQPPTLVDRDGSGRNQLMLVAENGQPKLVVALPGAASPPWQVVASASNPLLYGGNVVTTVRLNDTPIDEMLVPDTDGLLHVIDAAGLQPTGQTFPYSYAAFPLNWDGDARNELAFGSSTSEMSLVDPDGAHPPRTYSSPGGYTIGAGMLPRATAATSLVVAEWTNAIKVLDPRTGTEISSHEMPYPQNTQAGGIHSGDWNLDATGDVWWIHGHKLYALQDPSTLTLLQDGGEWSRRPLAIRQVGSARQILDLELASNEQAIRHDIVYRDASTLAELRRLPLANPIPSFNDGYGESLRAGDLDGTGAWSLVFQSGFGLTVHDAETGMLRWERPGQGGATSGNAVALAEGPCSGSACRQIAVIESRVESGSPVSRISLLDGPSGNVVWSQTQTICSFNCQTTALSYSDINGDQVPDIIHTAGTSILAIDGASKLQLWRIDGLPQTIQAIARSRDARGRLLTIDSDGVMRYHDLPTGRPWRELRYPSERNCLQPSCRLQYVVATDKVGYWAVLNGAPVVHWVRDDLRVSSAQPANGADYLVGGDDGAVVTGGPFGLVRSTVSIDDLFVDDFEGR